MKPAINVALTAEQMHVFVKACTLLRNGDAKQALAIADELTCKATQAADSWHLLAMCQAELGQDTPAEISFDSALQRSPDNFLILSNYAAWLIRKRRNTQAAKLLQRAISITPNALQPRIQLGLIALDEKNYDQAKTHFRLALEIDPKAVTAWHGLGNALRDKGDLDEAAHAFSCAVALAPDYAPAWINLGSVQRLQGLAGLALQSYRQAKRTGQGGAALEDSIVGSLVDLGRIDEALVAARRVVAEHPSYAPAHTTLANLLWQYCNHSDCEQNPLEIFEHSALAQPDNRALQLELIRTLLEARRPDMALSHVQRLYRKDSSDPAVQWLLADTYAQLQQPNDADIHYQQAFRQLGSSSASFLNAYTRFAMQLHRWQQAEQFALAAVRLDGTNQEGWANLSTAWRMQADAREFWLCDYDRLIGTIDIPPPHDYADLSTFLHALSSSLDALHLATKEPINQSLRHGSQTQGRLFGRTDPHIMRARSALLAGVEQWLAGLPDDPHHPFLARRPNSGKVSITGSWSVKLWSSGHHANHIHSRGWISSAFYVSLPPSVVAPEDSGHAGCIQFGQPLERFGLDIAPRRIIRPKPGQLALFPSYMWHGTVPFVDDAARMTIAFDMRPSH